MVWQFTLILNWGILRINFAMAQRTYSIADFCIILPYANHPFLRCALIKSNLYFDLKDVIVNGLLCVHIFCGRVLCTEFRFRFASLQPNWMVCARIFNKVKPISMNESNDWLCNCNSYVNKHTQTETHTYTRRFCEFDDKLSTSDLLLLLLLYAG